MKGLFFAKPIEYRLEIPADQWVQGETLQGSMSAVNRGADEEKKLRMEIGLAYGDFKKIKGNEPDALVLVERISLGKQFSLKPGDGNTVEWELNLPNDCPITSNEGSLFLLYGGNVEDRAARSKIDIRVKLAPVLETLVASIENYFAFAAKSRHHEDGFTEIKFKPPSSYPTLDELRLLMRLGEKENMELEFHCRTRGFGRTAAKGLQSKVVKIAQNYTRKEYLLPNSQPNRELFRSAMESVLAKATPGKVTKNKS
jgi:sporulation-control protein spo0M